MTKQVKKVISRRSFVLATGKVLLTSALMSRLFYLQVWRSDYYKTLSKENRIRLKIVPPLRGNLIDRQGVPIALNEKNYQLTMVREEVSDVRTTLQDISRLYPIEEGVLDELFETISKAPKSLPVLVAENLTWADVTRFEVRTANLPGVYIEQGYQRTYPYATDMACVTGYVQTPSPAQSEGNITYKLPGVKIGKVGLEKCCEDQLFGAPGFKELEVNSRGKTVRELNQKETLQGHDLKLSLDTKLQLQINKRLAQEKSASSVVLDAKTGHILAMSSVPSFDPNKFVSGLSHNTWNEWNNSPYKPLLNKTVQAEYAPGSIFKIVVALAALEKGAIRPNERITCAGHMSVSNHRYHCWRKSGHGAVDLLQALQESCDIYFYELALKVGIQSIAKTSRMLGLGEVTGVELTSERSGLVPDKEWKQNKYGKYWTIGETVLAGIGQGYLLTTPLQLAQLGLRFASGGKNLSPRLLMDQAMSKDSLGFNPAHLKLVCRGMNLAVNSERGTARNLRLGLPGWTVVGKTSTSQVRRITLEERRKGIREVPWHLRDHAMFMGYVPFENPKYVLSLVLEHAGWSSKAAVPVARDLFRLLYDYDQGVI